MRIRKSIRERVKKLENQEVTVKAGNNVYPCCTVKRADSYWAFIHFALIGERKIHLLDISEILLRKRTIVLN